MRWIFSSLLLLVLLLGAQALSPKMLEMKAFYESKMEVFSTLDEKEQLLVKTVGQFVAEVEEGKVASLSRTAQRDTAQRDTGFYADVQLENGEKFGVRQMAKVDVEQVITNFLSSQCLIPFCGTLIGGIIEVLLPDLVFLQSLNAEASAPSTQGSAALDLLIHLLTFPGSSGTLNSLLDQLLHVGVAPTTGLGYFEAKADYNLNFNAASLDLSAQAFAILQTYTRVIEFHDANSNKKYDEGEELSSISLSSAGWTPTSYTSQQAASATVHTISSTTNDGVVGFTCETSTLPVQDSLSQIITPNATKCTITIENFPFTGTASQLAMEVFVGVFGASFDGSASTAVSDFTLNVNSGPAGLQGGHFTWVPTVDVNGKSFAVSAEASAGASGGVVDFATSLLLKASGATEAQSMKVIFTFASAVNPSKVVWDPTIAYGDKPVLKSSAASLVPGSLLVLFATLLAFFF